MATKKNKKIMSVVTSSEVRGNFNRCLGYLFIIYY